MLSDEYCLSPQTVERREAIPVSAACQQSVVHVYVLVLYAETEEMTRWQLEQF